MRVLNRLYFLLIIVLIDHCILANVQHVSAINIRPAISTDIDLSLDLDLRVSIEYFKPMFINKYSHTVLGANPDYYIALDIVNDKKLFIDCVNMAGTNRLYIAFDEVLQIVVGLIVFHQEDSTAIEIDLLLIDKKYRSKGIGKKLVNTALTHFKDIDKCGVYVFSHNEQALAFYKSLGFVYIGPGSENKQTIYGISYAQLFVYYNLDI